MEALVHGASFSTLLDHVNIRVIVKKSIQFDDISMLQRLVNFDFGFEHTFLKILPKVILRHNFESTHEFGPFVHGQDDFSIFTPPEDFSCLKMPKIDVWG